MRGRHSITTRGPPRALTSQHREKMCYIHRKTANWHRSGKVSGSSETNDAETMVAFEAAFSRLSTTLKLLFIQKRSEIGINVNFQANKWRIRAVGRRMEHISSANSQHLFQSFNMTNGAEIVRRRLIHTSKCLLTSEGSFKALRG